MRWSEVAGDYLRDVSGGDEELFVCLVCNRPKLYRNKQTGLWHCHYCKASGRYATALVGRLYREAIPNLSEASVSINTALSELLKSYTLPPPLLSNSKVLQGREVSPTIARSFRIFPLSNGLLGFPLYAEDDVVGLQVYYGRGKYRTVGRRGIGRREIQSNTHTWLLLCEGFFDCLSLASIPTGRIVEPVFLAGNSLSEDQLAYLVTVCQGRAHRVRVGVAFDSDLEAPIHQAIGQLTPYFHSVHIFRPKDKDWDEEIVQDRERATKHLQTLLSEGESGGRNE